MASPAPLFTLPATELCRLLSSRDISSEELVRAHLDRISAVDGQLHAFTHVFHERAMDEARRADSERARGQVRGPLHGLPVSFKECVSMAGLSSTLGIPSRATNVEAEDAAIVTALREAGAVVLGRTNLSQMMLFSESRNPLFGQTANPFSLAHSPGGSSGGEAAAIAAGMSPLGVGGDLGGSIRSPASFTGICGLMPTLDRWPNRGFHPGTPGQEAIRSQGGPMARTVGDLALVMAALSPERLSALDPRCPPVPWVGPETVAVRGLRIGFLEDDGNIAPSPAIRRAIGRAVEVMRKEGCEVVPFSPPPVAEVQSAFLGALGADGARGLAASLRGGEVDAVMKPLLKVARLPGAARAVLARGLRLSGEERLAEMLGSIGERSVREYWELTLRLREYRVRMLRAFDEEKVDALLCPAFATPALPHGMARDFGLATSYAFRWNSVHFPGGSVPITRVRADETTGRRVRDGMDRHAAEVDRRSEGLPVGVQVVARPWREATVLAVMATLEARVRNDADFPRTPVTPA